MKQRFLSLFLAMVCVLPLAGCGEDTGPGQTSAPPTTSEEVITTPNTTVPTDNTEEQGQQGNTPSTEPEATTTPSHAQTEPAETPENSTFSIHFIDVGQADAALIECDGHYMLIDGGNKADSNTIYSVLKKASVDHLDMVVGTHAHEDHIGGLPGAFNYTTADLTLCPVKSYDSNAFDDFKKYADQKGGGIVSSSVGDTYTLGSALVEILGVNGGDDTNDTSIVLMITYGETKFLFTGDAEREAEQAILNSGVDLSATVLKVGHHGSDASTTYPFLREIMPQYAVISVGEGNSYGHPTEDTLSRLRDANVKVFRTDIQGDIICTSDGKGVSFSVTKNANADTIAIPSPEPTPTPTPTPEPTVTLSEAADIACRAYNSETERILDGTLAYKIVDKVGIELTYNVSEVITSDTEYLVDDMMEEIFDYVASCIVYVGIDEALLDEVWLDVSTNYDLMEENTPSTSEAMVWIPNSGKKYHSYSGCSNMKNPSQVTKSQAESMGFTPCKKCW